LNAHVALLEIKNLRKSFIAPDGTRQTILNIETFSLEAGSQVALAGSSGSGKTTFLHLIAGITTPDVGSIQLDHTEISSLAEPQRDRLRARAIGYIFQTFNLLPAYSCMENILLAMSFAGAVDHARAEAILRRVGLADRLRHRPHQLSTGQQQRVAVARALANRPKLVLADEPTGNLDEQNSREALALIRETCAETGAALLCVSHDPAVLERFEHTKSLSEINRPEPPTP
jgi:ABC-type lipoprotein export system ATPase subunit